MLYALLFQLTPPPSLLFFFFFNDTATTEIYTLSLHDALPSSDVVCRPSRCRWFSAYQSLQPSPIEPDWCPASAPSSVPTYRFDRPWVYSCWITPASKSPSRHGPSNASLIGSHRNIPLHGGIPSGSVS